MKKILYTILYIFLSFLFLESILAIFSAEEIIEKSIEGDLIISNYPNKTAILASNEFKVLFNTNQDGFRQSGTKDKYFPNLVLGDSISLGWGVEEKETYVTLLNKNRGFIFRNLALRRSSPVLYLMQLPHFLKKYKPQKILIQLSDNDLVENKFFSRDINFSDNELPIQPKKKFLNYLFGYSMVNTINEFNLLSISNMVKNKLSNSDYSILYFKPGKEPNDSILSHDQAFALFSSISSSSQEIQGKHQGLYAFYKNSETENWKKSISHQKKYLEEIIKLCEKEKIEVYFLYVPMKNFFSRKGFLGSAKTHTDENFYKKNPHYRMINTICESNKIKCFFANDFFVNKIPEILYFPLNGSLNREGHKVLFEYLNKSFPK